MMGLNLRGELTVTPLEDPSAMENTLIAKMSDILRLSSVEVGCNMSKCTAELTWPAKRPPDHNCFTSPNIVHYRNVNN